jgi:hypothetical protein
MLYLSSIFCACCVGDCRTRNMFFSDVPASEPMSAFCANSDSVPTVSSRVRPIWEATRPPWARP